MCDEVWRVVGRGRAGGGGELGWTVQGAEDTWGVEHGEGVDDGVDGGEAAESGDGAKSDVEERGELRRDGLVDSLFLFGAC